MARAAKKQIKIALEDVELIMGADFLYFDSILQNVYCFNCPDHMTTIVNYKIYLNNLEDIQLKGECKTCGGPVGRYVETGENPDNEEMAKHIREVIKKYTVIKKGK